MAAKVFARAIKQVYVYPARSSTNAEPAHPLARYTFGSFRIDTHDRLLLRDGQPVPIAPKVIETLLLLVSHAGSVVTKQEMLRVIWPDAVVDEGSLAHNISVLRRSLGDVDGAVYIETVPKRGYRFVANVTVEELGELKPAAPPAVPETERKRHRFRPVWPSRQAFSVIIFLLFCAAGVWFIARVSPPRYPGTLPFTSYVGGEYEPVFSPDGQRIAFVWGGEDDNNFDIYVRRLDATDLTRLTSNPAGEGSPTWSNDGGSVAFCRYSTSADRSGIFIVPAAGGAERKVAGLFPAKQIQDRLIDWSPADAQLAVSDKSTAEEPYSIFLLSIETGTRRQLTFPPAGSRGDSGPVFSRDGQSIAFRRTIGAGVNDIYLVSVSGGEPRRLTVDNRYTSAHDWSADDREIIFSSKRSGQMELWRVNARGGAPERIPGLGDGANFLAIARDGNRLAYSRWAADTNIWKLSISDDDARPARRLIASTLADVSPQYSADGTRIAFRSNRSGSDEIWTCGANGDNARQITFFGGPLTGSPRWSSDSKWIAFDSRPQLHSRVFVIPADGGKPVETEPGSWDDAVPSWSRRDKWLYVASNRTGSWQIWKVPGYGLRDARYATPVTTEGGFAPVEAPDGEYVYYLKGPSTSGVWRVSTRGGSEEAITSEIASELWGYWAVGNRGLYYVYKRQDGVFELRFLDLETRRVRTLRVLDRPPYSGDAGMSLSPDERTVLFAQADTAGSDIFLVENFR